MISTFGIHFAIAVQSVVSPAPAPAVVSAPIPVVIIDAVVIEAVVTEEPTNRQTAADVVTCSYTSDGTPGTGESGVTYTFRTGAAEAKKNNLNCS